MQQGPLDEHLVSREKEEAPQLSHRSFIARWWIKRVLNYNLIIIIAGVISITISIKPKNFGLFELCECILFLLLIANFLYLIAFSLDKVLYRFFNPHLANSARYSILGCIYILMFIMLISMALA